MGLYHDFIEQPNTEIPNSNASEIRIDRSLGLRKIRIVNGRQQILWLGMPILAGIAVLLFLAARSKEPTYRGKTAAEWFQEFRKARSSYMRTQVFPPQMLASLQKMGLTNFPPRFLDEQSFLHDRAADGLRALGTNAAHFLAQEVRHGDNSLILWYRNVFGKSPKPVQRILPAPPSRMEAQWDAGLALAGLGTDAAPAIPTLIAGLSDANPFCRSACIQALNRLAVSSEAVDPVLKELCRNRRLGIAWSIVSSLGVRTSRAAQVCGEALSDKDVVMRRRAVLQLKGFGPKAALVAPNLGAALTDSDSDVRQGAAYALESLGPAAAVATTNLIAALKSEDQELRYLSTRALGRIGTNSPLALAALMQMASDTNGMVQNASRRALQQMAMPKDDR